MLFRSLTYIDDVELRQRIEKQLNKIEASNRFSKAVFFRNNAEFIFASQEEQNIANNCKMIDGINSLGKAITAMLIENKKNAIILEEGANSLLKNVDDLNIASTDAASRLEETAAAIDEITGNIKSSTENINSISVYANELSNSANVGENLASKTVVSMEEINNQVNAVNEAYRDWETDRKSTRLNSSHITRSRMPSSA